MCRRASRAAWGPTLGLGRWLFIPTPSTVWPAACTCVCDVRRWRWRRCGHPELHADCGVVVRQTCARWRAVCRAGNHGGLVSRRLVAAAACTDVQVAVVVAVVRTVGASTEEAAASRIVLQVQVQVGSAWCPAVMAVSTPGLAATSATPVARWRAHVRPLPSLQHLPQPGIAAAPWQRSTSTLRLELQQRLLGW